MQIMTAAQLGETRYAHAGDIVEFEVGNKTVTGPLTEADAPKGSIYAYITVDGRTWTLGKMTQIKVGA